LRIGYQSPGSETGRGGSEIADSLRQIFEIFPFSGDRGRRPGSICTAWPSSECHSPSFPLWPPANWECSASTAAPSTRVTRQILCLRHMGQIGMPLPHCREPVNVLDSFAAENYQSTAGYVSSKTNHAKLRSRPSFPSICHSIIFACLGIFDVAATSLDAQNLDVIIHPWSV
jgi:hypothetical protein